MSKTPALCLTVCVMLALALPATAQPPEGVGPAADKALYCGGIFASITQFDIPQEDKDLSELKSQVAFSMAAVELENDRVPDSELNGLLELYVGEAMEFLFSEDQEGRFTGDECNELVGG